MPPSVEVLAKRLRSRSTDSEENIAKRLDKAIHEISKADSFDKVIINDDLEAAIAESDKAVKEFLKTNE
jgi:guanylate kinase